MPTFIDESGDTGPIAVGGTPHFHLAAVWVPRHTDADQFREKIRQLRRELGLRADYEFKFSKTHSNLERRGAFFRAALAQEFRFAVSSIDKSQQEWASAGRLEQYGGCLAELSALLRPTYCRVEATRSAPLREPIVVDYNSDREFLSLVKRKFHDLRSDRWPTSPMAHKVVFRNSAADEMLQLVDMICGTVCELTEDGMSTWYNLIAERDVEKRLEA